MLVISHNQAILLWAFLALLVGGSVVLLSLKKVALLPFFLLASLAVGQILRIRLSEEAASSLLLIDFINVFYVGVGLTYALIVRRQLPATLSLILFGTLGGWALLSLLFGLHLLVPREILFAVFYSLRFLLMIGTLLVTSWLFPQEESSRNLMRGWIMTAIALVILGYIQLIIFPNFAFMTKFGWDPHEGRLLSTFFDPNFFGLFLTFLAAILLGQWFYPSLIKPRWITFCFFLLTISALGLTFSRSGYLAFLVAFLVILTIRSWKLVLISLVAIGLVAFSVPKIKKRIIGAAHIDPTAQDRIQSWRDTIYIIKQSPVVGVGYNAFGPAQLRYGVRQNLRAHSAQGSDSSLLLIWATMGTTGLILYVLVILSLIYEALVIFRRSTSPYFRAFALSLLGIIPAYVVHSQFVNSFFYPLLLIPFLLLASTLAGGMQTLKPKQK